MYYNSVVEKIEDNRNLRLENKVIAIPWSLPRLSGVLPGIVRGTYSIVTANSKIGKSQLCDFLYMYQPIEWLIDNPNSGIKLKIFYFSLEMNKESKILSAISYLLFKKHKLVVSPQNLKSLFSKYVLNEEILNIIKSDEFQTWFNKFEEIVEFYDDIRNPYGIFNVIKTYAEAHGKYTYKEIDWINEDGSTVKKTVKDGYIPNDPNEFVIVITDHVSLLQPEKGESLHQAMSKFSSDYCLQMRDRYNYIPVNVQQQSAASEQQQFTNSGMSILEKLKPSADALGDNKLIGRDCNLMLGLFAPARYNFKEYEGWDLSRIGNNHRELNILLNRDGISNAQIQLYFQGSSNFFAELPREQSERMYKYIEKFN